MQYREDRAGNRLSILGFGCMRLPQKGRGIDLEEAEREILEASGKYVCSICGYVYDPAEHGGVAFEALPEDWRCPRCKQPKEKFNRA